MNEQELVWSAVIAWASSKFIEIMKRIPGVPLDYDTTKLNKVAAYVVALIATIGIHATFDPNAGTLMVTGLTASGIFQGIGEYIKQFMMQEIAYKKFIMNQPEKRNE